MNARMAKIIRPNNTNPAITAWIGDSSLPVDSNCARPFETSGTRIRAAKERTVNKIIVINALRKTGLRACLKGGVTRVAV